MFVYLFSFLLEIERVKTGRPEDQRVLDVHSGKHAKISFKVMLPVQEYPNVSQSRATRTGVSKLKLAVCVHNSAKACVIK